MRTLIILMFFIGCGTAYAQNQKLIDSLEHRLTTSKKDTAKVDLLNALAFEYRAYDVPKAFSLLETSLELSEDLHYLPGKALAYNHLGILNKNKKNFDEALKYHHMALELRKKLQDERGQASSYNNLGVTYESKNDPATAMKYYLQSLRIREKMADTPGMSAAYNNIGNIYGKLGNTPLAKQYNLKAIELRVATGDSFMVAKYCTAQGYLHYDRSESADALNYYKRALNIYKTVGDQVESSELMNNIANVYLETGKMDEAIQYHLEALKAQQAFGDTMRMFTSALSLTQAYGFKKDYAKALAYGKMSRDLLKIGGLTKMFMDYYMVMGELYKKTGNYKDAIMAYENYALYKDSFVHQQNGTIVTEMQVKYETEKKDREIVTKNLALSKAQYQLQKRNVVTASLIIFIVLLVLVGYLGYSRYKLKKQKELDSEIIKQQEMRSKAIIEAEEKERIRIAKDLHDGVGQQLSAIKLKISHLRDINPAEYDDNYTALLQMVDDAVREVRGVSHDMMPNALLRSGLAAATKEFIDKIAGNGKLEIDLQIIGLEHRLENTVETILYRVLQEAVNNIIKHAHATKISIQIIKSENELSLTLEDNGRGFDTSKINSFTGIGLKNIISRVEYMNGTVHFDSTIGRGTTVAIEIPVA